MDDMCVFLHCLPYGQIGKSYTNKQTLISERNHSALHEGVRTAADHTLTSGVHAPKYKL